MARRSLCRSGARHSCVTAEPEAGPGVAGRRYRSSGLRHDVNGHQPGLQGQVAAVHDRVPLVTEVSFTATAFDIPSSPSARASVPSPCHGRRRGQTNAVGSSAWLRDAERRTPASSGKRASKAARDIRAVVLPACLTAIDTNIPQVEQLSHIAWHGPQTVPGT